MIFDPSTLGTSANQITFNDPTSDPFYRLKSRMPQRREIREFDVDIPEQLGIADWESFIGKTYYIIEGIMYPSGDHAFWQGRQALQKLASLTVEQADAGADFGYVPYTWTVDDGTSRTINMKVVYVDMPESTSTIGKQPFRLFCKIKYPVILGKVNSAQIGGPTSTTTTTGSSILPFTLPRAISNTTYSSTGTLINSGVMPAYPTITVYGPVTNPKVTISSGQFIKVNTQLATSSDTLVIAYTDDELAVAKNGTDVSGLVTTDSTYFMIQPGNNTFTLTGDTVSAGAYATVSASDTYSIS